MSCVLQGNVKKVVSGVRKGRNKISKPFKNKEYRPSVQVLQGSTLSLLQFKYKHVHIANQQKLNELERESNHRLDESWYC